MTSSSTFTPQRRREIGDNLTTFFRTDDDIVGLVWLGSGADAFQDAHSDVDLLVVVRNGAVFPSVYAKWSERLKALYDIIAHYEERPHEFERSLHLLLDNFLALDVTFVRMNHLHAYDASYRIAFDKVGELDGILRHTLDDESIRAPRASYHDHMQTVWKPILKCAAAIKRQQTWHAITLLDEVRRHTIHLAGIAHDVDTHQASHIDNLPEMFLIHLRHTLPTSTSTPALRRALRATVLLLFEMAELIEDKLSLQGDQAPAQPLEARLLQYLDVYV